MSSNINRCEYCGGTDEQPKQHCQDCPLFDHIPEPTTREGWLKWKGKGCSHCGFTGYASDPIHDFTMGLCDLCKTNGCKSARGCKCRKNKKSGLW